MSTYIVVNAVNGERLFSSDELDDTVGVARRSRAPVHVCTDAGALVWDEWEPPSNPRYDELMARRKKLHDAWMGRVYHSKKIHGENSMMFWSAGAVLGKDGTLRITAFAPNSWVKLWELECGLDGKVVFTEVER